MAISEEAGMWYLLTKTKKECSQMRDVLENASATRPHGASIKALLEALPPALRAHSSECQSCREAAQDLFATRELLARAASNAEEPGPWFAGRVMAAIAARKRELAHPVSAWSVVPRFASRLSWMTAAVLLVGSTWLFERPVSAPTRQPSAVAAQEYLFEAPQPPMNQDDVLMSMAEKNQ
jgi:hypothetical protein